MSGLHGYVVDPGWGLKGSMIVHFWVEGEWWKRDASGKDGEVNPELDQSDDCLAVGRCSELLIAMLPSSLSV